MQISPFPEFIIVDKMRQLIRITHPEHGRDRESEYLSMVDHVRTRSKICLCSMSLPGGKFAGHLQNNPIGSRTEVAIYGLKS